jgi:hypothetical protein
VDTKRSAGTVQDSISAVELGKFPDDNVADSLSHITGVAISRTAGGEGQKVAFAAWARNTPSLLSTTASWRPTARPRLCLRRAAVGVISGADVIKGAQASLSEGAIGGLVNLRSAGPFDQPARTARCAWKATATTCPSSTATSSRACTAIPSPTKRSASCWARCTAEREDRTDIAGNDGGWTRNPDPNDESWLWGNAWGGNIDPNGNENWTKTNTA